MIHFIEFSKCIFRPLRDLVRLSVFKYYWRKNNRYNLTKAGNIFPIDKVRVGEKTYGTLNIMSYNNNEEKLEIGSYCSIAGEVKFLLSGEHDYRCFTNYPFQILNHNIGSSISKGKIVVQDDVWIGFGAIILSGVTLGKGCVVGAGSIVAKSIAPYAVFYGGQVIKYRFSKSVVDRLIDLDLSKIEKIKRENLDKYLYNITEDNIDEFINMYEELS